MFWGGARQCIGYWWKIKERFSLRLARWFPIPGPVQEQPSSDCTPLVRLQQHCCYSSLFGLYLVDSCNSASYSRKVRYCTVRYLIQAKLTGILICCYKNAYQIATQHNSKDPRAQADALGPKILPPSSCSSCSKTNLARWRMHELLARKCRPSERPPLSRSRRWSPYPYVVDIKI